jgi:Complex 1 protein (LYR family)
MSATKTLFRSLMKEARKIPDYNFRSYAVRRVRHGFEQSRDAHGYVFTVHQINAPTFSYNIFWHYSDEQTALFAQGQIQLDMLKRQSCIGNLFPSAKSVMEQ